MDGGKIFFFQLVSYYPWEVGMWRFYCFINKAFISTPGFMDGHNAGFNEALESVMYDVIKIRLKKGLQPEVSKETSR